jgi:hypothetical protein
MVEDLQPLVGHANLIEIGKYQDHAKVRLAPIFPDAVEFVADIPARLFNILQQLFNLHSATASLNQILTLQSTISTVWLQHPEISKQVLHEYRPVLRLIAKQTTGKANPGMIHHIPYYEVLL